MGSVAKGGFSHQYLLREYYLRVARLTSSLSHGACILVGQTDNNKYISIQLLVRK